MRIRHPLFVKVSVLLLGMALVVGLAQQVTSSLATAESADYGVHVVDQDGLALYLFLPDAPGASTCYDDCAMNWPPVLVTSGDELPSLGSGLNADLLDLTTRSDGSFQVTYGGWPLYHFAGDTEAGQVNGQGLGGNWFLVSAQGQGIGVGVDEELPPADEEEDNGG